MPRRRRLPPNPNALDWRDLEMPVWRTQVLIDNWTNTVVATQDILMSPYDEQMLARERIRNQHYDWRNDPSYSWSKKK
jgi:hypothetical protein